MKRALHIAKANLLKNKSAAFSLFIIIALVSALSTVGLSVTLGVRKDYAASLDRLNSLHNLFIMTREQYLPEFEEWLTDDPRVSQTEVKEALMAEAKMKYGGDFDGRLIILNSDEPMTVSAPLITDADDTVAREDAVYLPMFAKTLGFSAGDVFSFSYRNKPMERTVAGFFESNEASASNGFAVKVFAPVESYERLAESIGRYVWMAARCYDPADAEAVYSDLTARLDFDIGGSQSGSFGASLNAFSEGALIPVMIVSMMILIFSALIAFIALAVTRFRVTNGIENSMHDIGVMKASGYTSGQIIACYLFEYGVLALPAALLGAVLPVWLFSAVRQIMVSMTGVTWTLGVNLAAGVLAALALTALLLAMVWHSCARVKKLQPVEALRGGISTDNFRRNHIPLNKGAGGVHTRLGVKNIFVYGKTYVMIGAVMVFIALTLTVLGSFYMGFVLDETVFTKIANIDICELELYVTRRTDADALAAQLERAPEVRKTSMLDWLTYKVDGVSVVGYVSGDYDRLENMRTHEGRFPQYDNEIAVPKLLADQLGKGIGDSVSVRANGIALDYIITGFFSITSNGGRVGALTLDGFNRHDPNYKRSSVLVYLNEGESVEAFTETLERQYGVLNVYHSNEGDRFAAAKRRAEEKITNYMEFYGIDSVDYAVMYNGELILDGSSSAYQIERIINRVEYLKTQIGTYAAAMSVVMQVVGGVSLVIIALIITMSVRQIIIKRRRELGILKAAGFTSRQLALQMALSFLPCAALGVLAGCFAGAALASPIITIMFASTGVYNAVMPVSLFVTAALGVALLVFAFAAANMSAMRIKHISVYELISE